MKVRIRFSKEGNLRFIGHLDILRYFQKAFARAQVPVKYSEGFHPHPLMSFASPLSVGLTSEGEYLDTELEDSLISESGEEILASLNAVMADGIRVNSIRRLPEGQKKKGSSAMALIGQADYRVTLRSTEAQALSREIWISVVQHFMDQREIIVEAAGKKQAKKKKRDEAFEADRINIRPWILSLHAEGAGVFTMCLSAGSAANLKPETVMEQLIAFAGLERFKIPGESGERVRDLWLAIHRLDMRTEEGVSLSELGEEISI